MNPKETLWILSSLRATLPRSYGGQGAYIPPPRLGAVGLKHLTGGLGSFFFFGGGGGGGGGRSLEMKFHLRLLQNLEGGFSTSIALNHTLG